MQWSPSANADYPQMERFMAHHTYLSSGDRFNFLGSFLANYVSIENVSYRILEPLFDLKSEMNWSLF